MAELFKLCSGVGGCILSDLREMRERERYSIHRPSLDIKCYPHSSSTPHVTREPHHVLVLRGLADHEDLPGLVSEQALQPVDERRGL